MHLAKWVDTGTDTDIIPGDEHHSHHHHPAGVGNRTRRPSIVRRCTRNNGTTPESRSNATTTSKSTPSTAATTAGCIDLPSHTTRPASRVSASTRNPPPIPRLPLPGVQPKEITARRWRILGGRQQHPPPRGRRQHDPIAQTPIRRHIHDHANDDDQPRSRVGEGGAATARCPASSQRLRRRYAARILDIRARRRRTRSITERIRSAPIRRRSRRSGVSRAMSARTAAVTRAASAVRPPSDSSPPRQDPSTVPSSPTMG